VSAVLFAGFSAAHLIDEFVWGAPAEFHLAEAVTELLALVYMTALVGLIAAAARASRAGFMGLAIAGVLIGAADILKHGIVIAATGPWRFGAVSVGLVLGLTLSALATALASAMAWRVMRSREARSSSDSGTRV
jgi:hypothetical protein